MKGSIVLSLKKLSLDLINQWTGRVPHWSQLDPYSGLEDEGSSNDDAESTKTYHHADEVSPDDESEVSDRSITRRCTLQPRKRNYTCDGVRHAHTSSVFYQNQCSTPKRSTSTSASSSTSKPKVNADGPLEDRMEACVYNLRKQKRLDYTYPVIQEKLKHESSTESETSSEMDSDKIIIVTPTQSNQDRADAEGTQSDPPLVNPIPKGRFRMETFGVKRPSSPVHKKRKRSYLCKPCEMKFSNMTDYNKHYREQHKPVECEECGLSINTPSSLKCHAYVHKDLKYACPHCNKKFPFSSDRDIHAIKHETTKKFNCET